MQIHQANIEAKYRERHLDKIAGVAVHRCGWTDNDWPPQYERNARGMARFYRDNPEASKAVGGSFPYDFTINQAGWVEQTHPLTEHGWHAKSHSSTFLGVGVCGDFQHAAPLQVQVMALTQLLSRLIAWRPWLQIKRHDQLEGGSDDPSKVCPGRLLRLDEIEATARGMAETRAALALEDLGLVFTE